MCLPTLFLPNNRFYSKSGITCLDLKRAVNTQTIGCPIKPIYQVIWNDVFVHKIGSNSIDNGAAYSDIRSPNQPIILVYKRSLKYALREKYQPQHNCGTPDRRCLSSQAAIFHDTVTTHCFYNECERCSTFTFSFPLRLCDVICCKWCVGVFLVKHTSGNWDRCPCTRPHTRGPPCAPLVLQPFCLLSVHYTSVVAKYYKC